MKQAIDIAERLRRYGDVEAFDELCRVYEQLERKSDAIQRLWKERDGLRKNNAELLAALKLAAEINPYGSVENAKARDFARAAIAKAEGK